MSDVCAKPGTICALVASSGSQGMFKRQVWVDLMSSPSGRLMMRGFLAGCMSNTGAPGRTKCPVAPASAIASSTAICILDVWNIVSAGVVCGGIVGAVKVCAGLVGNVGFGLLSNVCTFVSVTVLSFLLVLLMTTVLSSSSLSKQL